jgi:hypothetical protein
MEAVCIDETDVDNLIKKLVDNWGYCIQNRYVIYYALTAKYPELTKNKVFRSRWWVYARDHISAKNEDMKLAGTIAYPSVDAGQKRG